MRKFSGFTLLEILIALFVFTILSTILAGALRHMMDASVSTSRNAERLRNLQLVTLMLSRDISQTVDRSILNSSGKEEAAFIGSPESFVFTHTGFANPMGTLLHSTLQRTGYYFNDSALWRKTWGVLDQAPQTQGHARDLLDDVTEAHFQYLDKDNKFHDDWPVEGQEDQHLPKAVRVNISISQWGTLSQLYVISAQPTKAPQQPQLYVPPSPQQPKKS